MIKSLFSQEGERTNQSWMHPLTEKVLRQDLRATARACRLCDDRAPGYLDLLRALFPHTGRAFLVGVTGNPGAGKSTVVDRLVAHYRGEGKRVGVVAIDPTSPFSGGAILGDRIRMQRHFEDPGVFIRSVATRGALGGLSRSAWDIVNVLDAWGADVVVIETVGVGQDELEITQTAHSTLVVVAPGLGDDVQANKAGLMECADVFAVNKADRDGADAAVRDLELMLALSGEWVSAGAHGRGHVAGRLDAAERVQHASGAWVPPIVRCVATRNEGIREVAEKLEAHRVWLGSAQGQQRVEQRQREQLQGFLRETLVGEAAIALRGQIEEAAARVLRREIDPYSVSEELVAAFRRGLFLFSADGFCFISAGAQITDPTLSASGASCSTDAASMEDQYMSNQCTIFKRKNCGQFLLNLLGTGGVSPSEALAKALDMSIYNDPFRSAKCVSEDDICGFSSDPRERDKCLKICGDLPLVGFNYFLC